MPYKNKDKDRQWHKLTMRDRRALLKLNRVVVTPNVTPKLDPVQPNNQTIISCIDFMGRGKMQPLEGTPWIDDIAEFVDSAAEDGSMPELDADGNPIPEY